VRCALCCGLLRCPLCCADTTPSKQARTQPIKTPLPLHPPNQGLSIPSLFANLATAAWIKFDNSLPAAAIVTAIMLASCAGVAWHHRKWTSHILTKEQLAVVGAAERIPLISRGLPFDW